MYAWTNAITYELHPHGSVKKPIFSLAPIDTCMQLSQDIKYLFARSNRQLTSNWLKLTVLSHYPAHFWQGRYTFRNQNCTGRYNFVCEKCTVRYNSGPVQSPVPGKISVAKIVPGGTILARYNFYVTGPPTFILCQKSYTCGIA